MLEVKEKKKLDKMIDVDVICPVCKAKQIIKVPRSKVINNPRITTISIPSGKICQHHFQTFIDKNFKVRGYQEVDFEVSELHHEPVHNYTEEDKELFENLNLEGNLVEYMPKNKIHKIKPQKKKLNSDQRALNTIAALSKLPKRRDIKEKLLNKRNNEMTLEEIYEEFWEFINEDNSLFREFIIKDKRRKSKSFRI